LATRYELKTLNKSFGVCGQNCNGIIPVAFFIVILVVNRFILNELHHLKENSDMEERKIVRSKNNRGLISGITPVLETMWAIGTSIAGADTTKK
jgi:uncharacterized protein YacL